MGARDTCIALLTVPWLALGPANIYKVACLNRGSPIAAYIVVPPAETCQAACAIARMWACLFWGLQTVVAVGIVGGGLGDGTAALAKAYVGASLAVAYRESVVREPVAAAACVELVVALLLLARRSGGGRPKRD